jgi:hypothetical protein
MKNTVAAVIIVAALLVGAILGFSYDRIMNGAPHTTVTLTTTVTTSVATSPVLTKVAFTQTGACSSPKYYAKPWSVMIGYENGSSFPLNDTTYSSYELSITFYLPAGSYYYALGPSGSFDPSSGTLMISGNGAPFSVTAYGPNIPCTTGSAG